VPEVKAFNLPKHAFGNRLRDRFNNNDFRVADRKSAAGLAA
jgi:hypothetical protein